MDFKNKLCKKAQTVTADFAEKQEVARLLILAGNPNVGKSTLFNAYTGLRQHTGNWSGKTVASAFGSYSLGGNKYILADVPGCYSLKTHSAEEECAENAICSMCADGVIVVCDAGALERNLNLVLQICEASPNVTVGINLADEAEKDGIIVDIQKLKKLLGVPVVKINARKKRGLEALIASVDSNNGRPLRVSYGAKIEKAARMVASSLSGISLFANDRYVALRLLENDSNMWQRIEEAYGDNTIKYNSVVAARNRAMNFLYENGIEESDLADIIAVNLLRTANRVCKSSVCSSKASRSARISLADRILTGKVTGFAVMMLLLSLVFYITLKGANYPSQWLSDALLSAEPYLYSFLTMLRLPVWARSMLVYGGYRVLSWVVGVMLPPMAIFFPLFTILEDVGYLPRVAFNLDRAFKGCGACGKQALTTCMGFGCNAAAVTGARIIDSHRERLIAILTNAFVPCNGRFPAMICLISVFFTATSTPGIVGSLYLTALVVGSVLASMLASKLLSSTLLKGMPSSFTLELPHFRRPQFGQIIVRSIFDRTVFVLGRAAVVAFPAGIVIWILSNVMLNGSSLISYLVNFLSPVGELMGLDGAILAAFLLGIPANEIVLPIVLMIYSSGSVISATGSFDAIRSILVSNGWTAVTALCTIIFFLMHWPCSTTLMTVKKESGGFKWALAAFLLPTLFGVVACVAVNFVASVML